MENTTLTLIVITNLLLVIVIGIFGFLAYRMIRDQKKSGTEGKGSDQQHPDYHPAVLERLKEAQLIKAKARRAELFCPNHPEEPGEVSCGICDRLFCANCIKPFKSLHFCREHLPLVMNNQWEEVKTVKTSTQDPENGVRVYDLKKKIFLEDDLPTYIETHYKINIDQDHIETYLVIYAISDQLSNVKMKFSED